MKPLDIKQRGFKADEITYLDRKSILLDRMLLNFFELLRFDGRRAVRRRKREISVESLVKQMAAAPQRFQGFAARPDVAAAWLTNDLLEIMNRGKAGRETVVGPRPFHLNAFKLANPKAAQDYGASMQVWAMLFHADRGLLARLREFFGRGLDAARDRYDGVTPLDLETLAVLALADQVSVDHGSATPSSPIRPLCTGQGRLLADDLRRLLAYEEAVPRHVLAGYIRTTIGLHLSLFILRLFRLVPAWVEAARRRATAAACPVDAGGDDVARCPYHLELVVDLTGDARGGMMALARKSAAEHLAGLTGYVHAVIALNRVKDFAGVRATRRGERPPAMVADLLAVMADPPEEMDGFFQARLADILVNEAGEEEKPEVKAILRIPGMSSFDQYVELVCLQRMKNERKKLVDLVDSLAQKNRPGGLLQQAAGARAPRWFTIGPGLLETLVQIAVVERAAGGGLRSRSVLLDDFMAWLRQRYGFVIYAPMHREVAPEEQEAWRKNEAALRERLRQTGFFTDLSDAYNSQTLRPRYEVKQRG